GHRLRGLFLRILRPARRLFPLFRGHAARRALYHGLPVARARPGGFQEVPALPDRTRQRQSALPQRQLLLQRGLLVSDRAARPISQTARAAAAGELGGEIGPASVPCGFASSRLCVSYGFGDNSLI